MSTARDSNAAERATMESIKSSTQKKIIRKMISKQFVQTLVFRSIFQCVLVLGIVQFGNPIYY